MIMSPAPGTGAPRRAVPAATYARLRARALRPPRYALMGEFSAGKSTLLNHILGREVAASGVTATQAPAIWFRAGESTNGELLLHDGTWRAVDAAALQRADMDACALIRASSTASELTRAEVIDTPGISDPMLTRDTLGLVAARCDFVIWCTHATQAWRQSEVAAWRRLPRRLRARSLLVATRADFLAPEDRDKVAARLARETEGLFSEVLFLASPAADAARARLAEAPGDAAALAAWESSGGAAFHAALTARIESSAADRRALLDRYAAPAPEAAPVAPVPLRDAAPAATPTPPGPGSAPAAADPNLSAMQEAPSSPALDPAASAVTPPASAPTPPASASPASASAPSRVGAVGAGAASGAGGLDPVALWDATLGPAPPRDLVALQAAVTAFLAAWDAAQAPEVPAPPWRRLLSDPLAAPADAGRAAAQLRREIVELSQDAWVDLDPR